MRSAALGGRTVHVRLLTPDAAGTWRTAAGTWPTLWLPLLHRLLRRLHLVDEPHRRRRHREPARRPRGHAGGGLERWYSDRWNNGAGRRPGSGRPSTLQELRRLLEKATGARGSRRRGRTVHGRQGALLYAARHPGMFRATAAYSALHPP
ncbi:hypothetical protein [Streptomyces sp. KL116D]|uniref:hypothetical protein n=1 Tax=Streptomyces sp. KL116D TaxID=3045152 RepID=UPI0035590F6B